MVARRSYLRLDPYRERAAILTSRGDVDATLYVRIETFWTQASGHLWRRRRTDPYEAPHGYMMFANGEFDDRVLQPDILDEELANWSQKKLRYVGELLDVEWLDEAASSYVRDQLLALDTR